MSALAARLYWSTWELRLGTWGYLSCLVFSLAVAILAQGWRAGIACGLAVALAVVFYRQGLQVLRRRRLWLLLGFMLVPSALFLGPGDWTVWGVTLSSQGLAAGAQMLLRSIAILVAATGFAASISVSELAGLVERAGLQGLGFAMGVAVNMLPTVQETVTTVSHALRLRGGFRRQRFQAVRLLLITVVVNTLRHADDIVSAAEARAFSTTRVRLRYIMWRQSDMLLAGTLLAVALALLLA
jgi:energy-coupling factor transport system permease protein